MGGDFHFNEWALIGAPCDKINETAAAISRSLSDLNIGYLDEEHHAAIDKSAFHTYYSNKIKYHHLRFKSTLQQKQQRKYFNDLDLLLINGNHFRGAKQIVFINEKKKESLKRKIDRLTDIRIIILENMTDIIYDFINELVDVNQVLVTDINDIIGISQNILKDFQLSKPPLYSLILAGGKSIRMGQDKGAIVYHQKAQREHLAELVAPYCADTFISCRNNQVDSIETQFKKLSDTFEGLGPYGGILSAFRAHPNHAWLTVACDLPYMNQKTIEQLLSARDMSKVATCFHNPETAFPEPLITIWEPRAYPILLEFLSQGYSCPRKVLINTNIKEIEMADLMCMTNVNDQKERDKFIKFQNR